MKSRSNIILLPILFVFAAILFRSDNLGFDQLTVNHSDISDVRIPNPDIQKRISEERVKSKLSAMTLREKIAQMIISSVVPENLDENSKEFTRLRKLCENSKVGGFIFFKGSVGDYVRISNRLQEFSETPLLFSADFERGTGMRVTNGVLFPNNMAIGATNNPTLAYSMGLEVARESKLLGIGQVYAPVCDVNNNPLNPIINVRSFGEDPSLVSKMSAAMIKGLQDGKVIATAKHFPGHGDTEIDSHKDLPVLNFSMDRLNSIELVPFKNAIVNNVMSIMIAHLSFPVLESKEHIPASLSPNIVNGLLMDNLGFSGLAVTDALNMKGITKYFTISEVAVMCVNAGIDLILMPLDEEKSITAIENAVNSGEISESRIDKSVEKILKAKEWLGLFENKLVDSVHVHDQIKTNETDALGKRIADESITLVKDDNKTVPTGGQNKSVRALILSDGGEDINTDDFSSITGTYFPALTVTNFSSFLTQKSQDDFLEQAASTDYVLVGIFAKIRYGPERSLYHNHRLTC